MRQANDFPGLRGRAGKAETRKAGQVIFRPGEPARHLYFLEAGEVQIRSGDTVRETVLAGGVIGAMALVDEDAPRPATAVAVTDCELVLIDEQRYLSLVQQTPSFALGLMRLVVQRVQASNSEQR